LTCDHVTANKCWLYFADPEGDDPASDGVWETTDGGANWTRVRAGLINTGTRDMFNITLKSAPGNEDHLWMTPGGVGGSPNPDTSAPFRRSVDGGRNWTTPNTGVLEVKAFGFGSTFGSYPRIYIVGWYDSDGTPEEEDYGVYYSDDAGATWTAIGLPFPLGAFDIVQGVEGAKNGTEMVFIGQRGSGFIYGRR
jgi:hypothetical protein